MSGPGDLPDFDRPPLNEVILGVQFAPPPGYQQIYAGDIWKLFSRDFPRVQEHPALPSSFETFGRPQNTMNLAITTEVSHNRYWFLSKDGDEIIQFQRDRLLHNWRKVGTGTNLYPRFETILPKFENELLSLDDYFANSLSDVMKITQCELTYINHILLTEEDATSVDKWIRLINLANDECEAFAFSFRKRMNDKEGNPYGRLICEGSTALNKKDEPLIFLELTVRGTPKKSDIPSALNFLINGREVVVNFFDEITTEFAHEKWGKK